MVFLLSELIVATLFLVPFQPKVGVSPRSRAPSTSGITRHSTETRVTKLKRILSAAEDVSVLEIFDHDRERMRSRSECPPWFDDTADEVVSIQSRRGTLDDTLTELPQSINKEANASTGGRLKKLNQIMSDGGDIAVLEVFDFKSTNDES